MEIDDLKQLLSKKTLKKQEKQAITELANAYGIELECTTCSSRWTTAILAIIETMHGVSEEPQEREILKPQYQRGVYIGGVFVCEHNANDYMTLIERYAPNILAI